MQGRELLLDELLHNVDGMISSISEREAIEPDFAVVREMAEQLKEELDSLQEN